MSSNNPEHRNQKRADVEINSRLCKGCRYCVSCCPPQVLAISEDINERGYNYAYYLGDGCTGCGLCFYNCPEIGAILVRRYATAKAPRTATVAL
jgi:NAD-dependent dihydropyrimidine dehydrogenase PreA subunit